MSEVAAAKALCNVKRLSVRMPLNVEPASVVETRGVHHQRVALPVPNRVAHPSGIGIFGKLAPVGENGAMNAVGGALIEDHDQSRGLDEAGQVHHMVIGKRIGQAGGAWSVFAHVANPLLIQRLGPGLNIFGAQVSGDIAIVAAPARPAPHAGQIWFSIRRARRGRGKIGLAIRRARDARRGVIQPLRGKRRRHD